MKKEPNFLLSPTLGNLYVFSRSRARCANVTKRSEVQFIPFTSDFYCATTENTKGKNRE